VTTVVTGPAGHVGANLVPELLERGHRVRVLIREDTRGLEGLDVERVQGSILEPGDLDRAFAGARTVFHLAGRISIVGDPDGAVRRTNVDGVRAVVEACERAGVERLVHTSSIHARSPHPRGEPVTEERELADTRPGPAYDHSKAGGEREILAGVERGLDAVIVAPTGIIGPRDHKPSHTGAMILALAHRKLPALVDGGFNWVDVRDVARGVARAAEHGRRGERYLLGGSWRSMKDLAAVVAEQTGVEAPGWVPPMTLARIGAPFVVAWAALTRSDPLYTSEALHALRNHRDIVCDKAERELDHRPRPFEDTIADTVQWFRDAGMLG